MNIADPSGWGAAEWIAIATVAATLIGTLTTAIVQLAKLRRENTSQHAEGRALVTDVRDRLLDLHQSVDRIDGKIDRVADRLADHLDDHTKPRRRWRR